MTVPLRRPRAKTMSKALRSLSNPSRCSPQPKLLRRQDPTSIWVVSPAPKAMERTRFPRLGSQAQRASSSTTRPGVPARHAVFSALHLVRLASVAPDPRVRKLSKGCPRPFRQLICLRTFCHRSPLPSFPASQAITSLVMPASLGLRPLVPRLLRRPCTSRSNRRATA